jgi:hypothetical protein
MKKVLLGLAVVAMAAATSAFTENNNANVTTHYYQANSEVLDDLREPSNWSTSPAGANCNTGTELPCAIEFTPSAGIPDFETYLETRDLEGMIQDAISTKSN